MILQNSHLPSPFVDAFTALTKSGQKKPKTGRIPELRPRISQPSSYSEESIEIQSRKDPNNKKVIKKPRDMNRLHCLVAGNMQQASQTMNTGLNCSDIFFDSSDLNEARYSVNSSPQIKVPETQAADSLNEMFKLKKRGASRGSKDLLYLLNNQIQNEAIFPRTRVGKNRDSFLYKNLNQLMGGRSNPESAVIRADPVNFPSNDTQASLVDDEYDRFDDLQEADDLGNFGGNMLNNNFIHSSINTVREKIAKQLMTQSAAINKNKKIWNVERELQLLKYFEIYGQDWEAISMAINLPEITPSAAEERYKAKFLSNTSKARFTPQEDQQIAFYYTKFGPNWKKMQEFFPDRTEAMIRNRFNSKIKKKNVKEFLKTSCIVEPLKNGEPNLEENSSGSPFNNLDGKATAKNSEPEVEMGTLEAVDMEGYCFSQKKLKTDTQTQFITTRIAGMNIPANSYVPVDTIGKDGWKNQNAVREAPVNALDALNYNCHSFDLYQGQVENSQAQFENFENFDTALQLPKENVQDYRQTLSPRNDFGVKPYKNNFKQRADFDYWDFGPIEDQIKNPNDFIDFERGSDKRQEQEPHFSSINNENCYLNYLNFQEDEPGNFREQPLLSICGSPRQRTPYSMQEPVSYKQQDFQQPPRVQNEQPQFNEPPAYKLNQLETLLSQIKSMEAIFDRTKQQISQLQNRYTMN